MHIYRLVKKYRTACVLCTMACIVGVGVHVLIGCSAHSDSIVLDASPPAQAAIITNVYNDDQQISFTVTNPNTELIRVIPHLEPVQDTNQDVLLYRVDDVLLADPIEGFSLSSAGNTGEKKRIDIYNIHHGEYRITLVTTDSAGNAHVTHTEHTIAAHHAFTEHAFFAGLALDPLQLSAHTIPAGAPVSADITIHNTGSQISDTVSITIYRSEDPTDDVSAEHSSAITHAGQIVEPIDAGDMARYAHIIMSPTVSGTYYYTLCIAPISDTDTDIRTCSSSVAVHVLPGVPDLTVPTITPDIPTLLAEVTEQSVFTLNTTIHNAGLIDAPATMLTYYRSTDTVITGSDDDTMHAQYSLAALAVQEQSMHQHSVEVPAGEAGVFHYGACVESVPDENATANNCSPSTTVTISLTPYIDLVPRFTNAVVRVDKGASFTLNAEVHNIGNVAAGASTISYLRTMTHNDFEDAVVLESAHIDAIANGGVQMHSITLDPIDTIGTYSFALCVETTEIELLTTNNCASTEVIVIVADLDIKSNSRHATAVTVTAGASFTWSSIVHNIGTAPAHDVVLQYMRAPTRDIHMNAVALGGGSGREIIGTLAAGSSRREYTVLSAPTTAGVYYYGGCVRTSSNEDNTLNNCSEPTEVLQVTVPLADLTVHAASTEKYVDRSEIFTLSFDIHNQGNASAHNSTLRVIRSASAHYTNATTIETDILGTLAPNARRSAPKTFRASSTAGATHYYGVCASTNSAESDTENNCSPLTKVVSVEFSETDPTKIKRTWKMVWSDEFNGTSLDTDVWSYAPRWNNPVGETDRLTSVRGGNLVLTVDRGAITNNIVGGEVRSRGNYHKTYGYFEARFKLPHPIPTNMNANFWMNGNDRSISAEIDIMETHYGHEGRIQHALHWFDDDGERVPQEVRSFTGHGVYDGEWHTISVLWNQEHGYIFYIDGQETFRPTRARVSSAPSWIILGVNISNWLNQEAPRDQIPFEVLFDYVRVYDYNVDE